MKLHTVMLAGLLAVSGTLHAQTATTFGDPGCSEWFAQPNATKKLWLLGFLSGMNVATDRAATPPKDTLAQLGSASQAFLWVDNHCRANPQSTVEAAGVALMAELAQKRRR